MSRRRILRRRPLIGQVIKRQRSMREVDPALEADGTDRSERQKRSRRFIRRTAR
jgi:hypothetical protein